jgi:acetylornithine deacetylase
VALAELRRVMEAERPPYGEVFPAVPFVALNVGTVSGGSAANVIPDRCEIHLGVRVLPAMTAEEIGQRIADAVRGAVGPGFTFELVSESPAMLVDQASPVHRAACEAVGQQDTGSVMFATDAGWLQRAGFECVLLGPGSIEVAHRANEWLPVDQFRRGGEVLDQLIDRCCVRR